MIFLAPTTRSETLKIDPENPEWTKKDFAKAKSFADVFPDLAATIRRRGPQKAPTKTVVTIRLSPDLARGQVVARTKLPSLRWPATAAIVGRELVVANTQFNKRRTGDPELPFTLERVPLATLAPR